MLKFTENYEEANLLTHGGTFHGDDVLATAILGRVLDEKGVVRIARVSKVPEGISEEDTLVYDIGGGRFDHHQKGGNGTHKNGVPYASAGLIWNAYGILLCTGTADPVYVYEAVEQELIIGIDAIDNGVSAGEQAFPQMTFSKIIAGFNPQWDSTSSYDEAFERAVDFATVILDNCISSASSRAKAMKIVEAGIESSENHIMVLERFVPWQEALIGNEKGIEIQFVVFPSNRGGYNWQCVPVELGSFAQRKPVPSEWKGLTGAKLQEITGVSTATFCHQAGFIGSAETLEDAILMATLAVNS